MKFVLFPILVASLATPASGQLFYSEASAAGASNYIEAANFCQSQGGQVLAAVPEWCSYAAANNGIVYGMAPIGEDGKVVDIEEACGIPKPTEAPTKAPTETPTVSPSKAPSGAPTKAPTEAPTRSPTKAPTLPPTMPPTLPPTMPPTLPPTNKPTTATIVRTSARVPAPAPTTGPKRSRALEEAFDSILCAKPKPSITTTTVRVGSGSGDPHFKTWTGEKFDYHGECDLVLLDNPNFDNGRGLKVHVRTTRVKYFSFIEKVAIMIGTDVLEFGNSVEKFFINGERVPENQPHHKTMLGDHVVNRLPKALSIRFQGAKEGQQHKHAKIDLIVRKNGFPAVIVDDGESSIFEGSLGLLGNFQNGAKLARDGRTLLEDATDFALEWQVRDHEPMLFQDARFPQFPATCVPPKKVMGNRLGQSHMRKQAEEACGSWENDSFEDCVFDVIATRDVTVADEEEFDVDVTIDGDLVEDMETMDDDDVAMEEGAGATMDGGLSIEEGSNIALAE